jgi:hypothetical protein
MMILMDIVPEQTRPFRALWRFWSAKRAFTPGQKRTEMSARSARSANVSKPGLVKAHSALDSVINIINTSGW